MPWVGMRVPEANAFEECGHLQRLMGEGKKNPRGKEGGQRKKSSLRKAGRLLGTPPP